jgi:hypothetical protein
MAFVELTSVIVRTKSEMGRHFRVFGQPEFRYKVPA